MPAQTQAKLWLLLCGTDIEQRGTRLSQQPRSGGERDDQGATDDEGQHQPGLSKHARLVSRGPSSCRVEPVTTSQLGRDIGVCCRSEYGITVNGRHFAVMMQLRSSSLNARFEGRLRCRDDRCLFDDCDCSAL